MLCHRHLCLYSHLELDRSWCEWRKSLFSYTAREKTMWWNNSTEFSWAKLSFRSYTLKGRGCLFPCVCSLPGTMGAWSQLQPFGSSVAKINCVYFAAAADLLAKFTGCCLSLIFLYWCAEGCCISCLLICSDDPTVVRKTSVLKMHSSYWFKYLGDAPNHH